MAANVNLTYYQKNKERIKAYAHNYYHNNKDIMKQKIVIYTQEKKNKISNYYKEKRNKDQKKKLLKQENMQKIGIVTYLKKSKIKKENINIIDTMNELK